MRCGGAHLWGMNTSDHTRTTSQAGTLTLTIWPDTPVGAHQRYAYRITEATSGQVIEGRDLFTGAGALVDPTRAMRDLAGYLSAAGEARQYALDHPDHTSENEGLFPVWVAEAARLNADALTELSEDGNSADSAAQPTPGEDPSRRWISVVFLQGDEADQMLGLIDHQGTDAAIEHLAGFDYGEDTVQDALENGYVYDEPPSRILDQVASRDVYRLTYSHSLGHVHLLREYDAMPDPALLDIDTPTPKPPRTVKRDGTGPAVETDWFGQAPGRPGTPDRGLGL